MIHSPLSIACAILEQGLSRMGRHHVHLAKGLLGEKGVISGMRQSADLFIWVNVHEAIRGGLVFYESANGVILCSGRDGDGRIPPTYFSVVIELRGGLCLEPAQAMRLAQSWRLQALSCASVWCRCGCWSASSRAARVSS